MTLETRTVLANARDVAAAVPGLRAGIVWRSDAPFLGDAAPAGLAPWPPTTVVDLRDPVEAGGRHPLAATSTVHAIPVLADAAAAGSRAGASLTELYRGMITGDAGRAVAAVAITIAVEDGPVLVHCSAGKDRTGVSVALVLALIGTARDSIVADYVVTAANMGGVVDRMAAAWAGEATGSPTGVDVSRIPAAYLTAPADAIEVVLDAWDAYGGAETWFLAHGGSAAHVAALRERLLG
ncbi:tyrosine-protein phosphatase [Demequina sp. SYSU T00039]|uniref:Tyrosine-protein phosphatase n=1 Tax=Demequina lignilytica TaxID=3051663 RepID=A0AAW7M916_9MICO|nr:MULTISPECIES: tyrosine-protein phosphatase [unclassified Demequina]MDN4478785.1 tyrosine-protein phosphatase [Demequina sp. SYSU T00039-1]MDN4488883.1 tyrosine-protein phosphatase [Demequina sp. SYSU T00039]